MLNVTVPPASPEGSTIAVQSEYCVPEQSTLVDFVFVVRWRRGADIFYLVNVPIGLLRLGNSVQVPTLSGSNITLPITGSIIRLHGYGLPHPVNPMKRGDLVVGLDVVSRLA